LHSAPGRRVSPGAYAWDNTGNPQANGLTIGAGNRLLQDTVWNYSYDGEGNLIQKVGQSNGQTWTYQYDHLNRLVHVHADTTAFGPSHLLADVSYSYDALGRRVSRQGQAWAFDLPTMHWVQTENGSA
jgi:YD repeat-containing protein